MDTLQAAILNFRLTKLDKLIEKEEITQKLYFENIFNKEIELPIEKEKEFHLSYFCDSTSTKK